MPNPLVALVQMALKMTTPWARNPAASTMPALTDRSSWICRPRWPGVSAGRTDEGLVADLDGTGRAAALQALVAAGIAVDAFTPRRRLEDAFLALVGEGA